MKNSIESITEGTGHVISGGSYPAHWTRKGGPRKVKMLTQEGSWNS